MTLIILVLNTLSFPVWNLERTSSRLGKRATSACDVETPSKVFFTDGYTFAIHPLFFTLRSMRRRSSCPTPIDPSTPAIPTPNAFDPSCLRPRPQLQQFVEVNQTIIPFIKDDGVHTISALTYENLRRSKVKLVTIDNRFPFEYQGGHIKDAINLWNRVECAEYFVNRRYCSQDIVYVFHCEFSSQRAPSMFSLIRTLHVAMSRKDSQFVPPNLFVLEKGYKNVFNQCGHLCDTHTYTQMHHSDFASELSECEQTLSSSPVDELFFTERLRNLDLTS